MTGRDEVAGPLADPWRQARATRSSSPVTPEPINGSKSSTVDTAPQYPTATGSFGGSASFA
ncbi:hypothetical protein [Micromonospora sp. SL4-19]|uniref:hypothetical protein n=1 Tax=Micromonospora sp. SL4-19 TaxID=3399129 RepID=UPI003A4DE939